MDLDTIMDGADRFAAYVEELRSVIGHADLAAPLQDYCAGLLTAEARKSIEPMAAVTAPAHVSVQQSEALAFRRRRKVVGREGARGFAGRHKRPNIHILSFIL
jgi:SRSO17 transposase